MLGYLGNLLQRIGRMIRPSELHGLDPAEADQLARDIGVTSYHLHRLSKLGPDAAKLLYDRLVIEGIDAQQIENDYPKVMKDMQRTCSCCSGKMRCEQDMKNTEESGDDWKSYCPNATTIDYLW